MFLCITCTPLGFPVEPEVYIVYAISVGLMLLFLIEICNELVFKTLSYVASSFNSLLIRTNKLSTFI